MPRILPNIAVVIPTLGRPILKDCLQALADGTNWPARLLLVDQSRSGQVASWLTEFRGTGLPIEHVLDPGTGQGAALNKGVERVRTPFVAFTDDDCLVAGDWLDTMAAKLSQNPGVIVTGRMDPAGPEPAVSARTSRRFVTQRRPPLFGVELLTGGNMGASRRAIDRIGPFEEDLRIAVALDRDWAYRALRAGFPIAYCPEVVVRHVGWRDTTERASQYHAYGRSQGAFYAMAARRGDALLSTRFFVHLGYAIGKAGLGWLLRKPEQRLAGTAFLRGMIPGLIAGLRRTTSLPRADCSPSDSAASTPSK